MSLLTYNGVSLPYPYATHFEQRPVYDESGTDWYCTEFDITVQVVLSLAYAHIIVPAYVGPALTSAAELMNYVRLKLSQPRRLLSYRFNGTDLVPAQTGGAGTVDVDNGPKPVTCQCTMLTNNTFIVVFRVKARYWESTSSTPASPGFTGPAFDPLVPPNAAGNPVLYNRWSETADIDNCLMTTRTRQGKYKIRSDNADGKTADMLRSQMAVIGVPEGFNRVSAKYTVTPDGLGIEYTIVDKEVFKHPPRPAYEASGDYTETISELGAVKVGAVTLHLKGAKTSDQTVLIDVAVKVAATKLRLRQIGLFARESFKLLRHFKIRVGMYENTVSVEMAVMFQPRKERASGVPLGDGQFNNLYMTTTPLSEANSTGGTGPPVYSDRGTSDFLLQAAAYFDPTIADTALAGGEVRSADNPLSAEQTQMSRGLIPGQAGSTSEAG